jgi:hypothetical protein
MCDHDAATRITPEAPAAYSDANFRNQEGASTGWCRPYVAKRRPRAQPGTLLGIERSAVAIGGGARQIVADERIRI